MSVSKLLYGVEQPSSVRRHCIHGLYLVIGLFVWGVYSDFIPSQSWAKIGWYIALCVGTLITILAWRAYWTGRAEFRPHTSRFMKSIIFFFMPVFCIGLVWVALIHGIGSLISLSFGNKTEAIAELRKERHYSRRSCDYRLEGEFLDKAFPSHICIGKLNYQNLPANAIYIVKGHKHYLGFVADGVYLKMR